MNKQILVDPQDQWLLNEYTWHENGGGFAYTNLWCGKRVYTGLHHCIMGRPLNGGEIEFLNGNRLDCRRSNMRMTTVSEKRIKTDRPVGASGARNIWINNGKFAVMIRRNGAVHYLGKYDTLDEAVATRDEWLHHQQMETNNG